MYRSQVKEREMELSKVNETTSLQYFDSIFVPEVFCPNKVRLGKVRDGGKWICSPHLLGSDGKDCVIYALGSNDETSFQEVIQKFTDDRCKIRGRRDAKRAKNIKSSNVGKANKAQAKTEMDSDVSYGKIQLDASHFGENGRIPIAWSCSLPHKLRFILSGEQRR
ncbi:methyltransferase domain-containing protein [Ditylenchus destructor]|nr:methyltransferase domain-containing protein [Ditylenchus destructor]